MTPGLLTQVVLEHSKGTELVTGPSTQVHLLTTHRPHINTGILRTEHQDTTQMCPLDKAPLTLSSSNSLCRSSTVNHPEASRQAQTSPVLNPNGIRLLRLNGLFLPYSLAHTRMYTQLATLKMSTRMDSVICTILKKLYLQKLTRARLRNKDQDYDDKDAFSYLVHRPYHKPNPVLEVRRSCKHCNTVFPSRNKLFMHLQAKCDTIDVHDSH